jgi:hypothetical protein
MGHSQMLLAVAGMKQDEIKHQVQRLASGDWSEFTPAERQAFQFGARLSKAPAALSNRDLQMLVETFGPHRAVDVIWRSAWCNYMTRVADAFQLPLEQTNVFTPLPKEKEKAPAGK